MFFFFSNRLGCFGSLLLSVALTVVLLLVIVQLLQWAGDRWARRMAHV